MKKAFTLLELLVVVAIAGMMSTLAIGSYSAITRGMNDRAALDVAKTLVDAAVQRAQLDRSTVHVYLFDELLQCENDTSAGVGSGVAIAVRPVGRISLVAKGGELLCDEFAELDQVYGALEERNQQMSDDEREKNAATFRLYNMRTESYATVMEGVDYTEVTLHDLEEELKQQEAADSGDGSVDVSPEHTKKVYGFKKVDGEDGANATFRAGDLYGQEFAVTRLPPGYFFHSGVDMKNERFLGQRKYGSPLKVPPTQTGTPSLEVWALQPDGGFRRVGNTGTDVEDGK